MAGKGKRRKHAAPKISENMLPQNILAVGGHVEENKNIYISQPVYKQIRKFTGDKTVNESGGVLVGSIMEAFGKTNILISGFVEAKFCEATPTTLKFTHETWEYVHKEIEKKHPGKKIVGWIHTHPNFGIFLSEYDKFIHENFFHEEYQTAYVIDPIQQTEGFYFWIQRKIERCKGFYIYDKNGTDITISSGQEGTEDTGKRAAFDYRNFWLGLLSATVIFLLFFNISMSKSLNKLERQQKTLADSANQSLVYMQEQLWQQALEIEALKNRLKEAGLIAEAEEGENVEEPEADTRGESPLIHEEEGEKE